MNWQNYIHSDPNILLGKPVIEGTRLSVEFLTELLKQGWTEEQILENYPSLNRKALKSIIELQQN